MSSPPGLGEKGRTLAPARPRGPLPAGGPGRRTAQPGPLGGSHGERGRAPEPPDSRQAEPCSRGRAQRLSRTLKRLVPASPSPSSRILTSRFMSAPPPPLPRPPPPRHNLPLPAAPASCGAERGAAPPGGRAGGARRTVPQTRRLSVFLFNKTKRWKGGWSPQTHPAPRRACPAAAPGPSQRNVGVEA